MQLPKELTTVTPLSKTVALIMFIMLPVITFTFGMRYQSLLTEQSKIKSPNSKVGPSPEPVACTMDAKICPDGSAVGRIGPDCEFEECPTIPAVGKTFTGSITSISYECHMDGICGIGVGKSFVVVDQGEGPPGESRIRGTYPEDLMDEDRKSYYLGKSVEVFAQSPDGRTDSYTLFGSSEYYIRLVDEITPQTFCGGIAGKLCPNGFYCKYEGTYPDAGGTCIKNKATTTKYTCPENEYVDCMPPISINKVECSSEFLQWAQENCPNFSGAAY